MPSSIRALVEDAEWKAETLKNIYEKLKTVLRIKLKCDKIYINNKGVEIMLEKMKKDLQVMAEADEAFDELENKYHDLKIKIKEIRK